ncbi:hypothetical protein BPOR_0314g00130 [Botrytis porri]|uniref:Uncharacterized protein n=1 Tax=Botrytis porri TaxID=87229 RepID=A0A4Z1KL58_9HELO|nr:hypothetical protein BPOR_0314g00130 [Botrytis porri]
MTHEWPYVVVKWLQAVALFVLVVKTSHKPGLRDWSFVFGSKVIHKRSKETSNRRVLSHSLPGH